MYILGIDQSTQGTKAVLVNSDGGIVEKADCIHRQIINEKGWISHDLDEIYKNVISVSKEVILKAAISPKDIKAIGISNQRETSAIWHRNGTPLNHAIVWQCSRAKDIVKQAEEHDKEIRERTGLNLSAFFPASKMSWLLQNTENIQDIEYSDICLGTIDSWLVYCMTKGKAHKTDYSNASRTQLFNIHTLEWDDEICNIFHIPKMCLPEVCDSNAIFGMTDLEGVLPNAVPIHCVLGDSHAALYGQGCCEKGMIKTTYGTGSSIMMNVGNNCVTSRNGLVTSLAWGIDGQVSYVLEGNINYTGAVITWLKDDLGLIDSPEQTEDMAFGANPDDGTVIIPAFSGLSAPYWKDEAKAIIYGMTRTTGKKEIVRAGLDSIAFQIHAVLDAVAKDTGIDIGELRVDGGPTKNNYLMQAQSDISNVDIIVSDVKELSALGVSYLAGISTGILDKERAFSALKRNSFRPLLSDEARSKKISLWNDTVQMIMR